MIGKGVNPLSGVCDRFRSTGNAIRAIFDEVVLDGLFAIRMPTEALRRRLQILTACGPAPSDRRAADTLNYLRGRKAAWEAYFSAAICCGLFDHPHGMDLRSRLTRRDDEGFRSALAECMACWFLAGKLGMSTRGYPGGRNGRQLDLETRHASGILRVEVKAPFRALPLEGAFYGNDADMIRGHLSNANEKFHPDECNIVVFVPTLRRHVFRNRDNLTEALFGHQVMRFAIDRQDGSLVGEPWSDFLSDGAFLRRIKKAEPHSKASRPGFTRIGAVLSIEERPVERRSGQINIEHDVLVVHNPYASRPISQSIWKECVQFLPHGPVMAWTDGYRD